MKKIALLPGGFKPPHAGHYNMAKWLSTNTGADKTIIFIGPKERDGITQEMSLELWELYIQNDPKLEIRKAGVSPVRDVYDFIEQEAPIGSTVFLGMGEKDTNDKRFANIPKFAEPRGITFKTELVPPQAGGVSGTEMRGFIRNDQEALFYNSLPDHVSEKDKQDAWSIVTKSQENPLNEDLYDPNDHVSDYMKSSEWKAGMPDGPKKDITPSYKYKRGGLYGKMYEFSDSEIKYWALHADIADKLDVPNSEEVYNKLKSQLTGDRLGALEFFYNEYFKKEAVKEQAFTKKWWDTQLKEIISENQKEGDKASKIFVMKSPHTPNGQKWDHIGFILNDGRLRDMSGHRGSDKSPETYKYEDTEELFQMPKDKNEAIKKGLYAEKSLPKEITIPNNIACDISDPNKKSENCGSFVKIVLSNNGIETTKSNWMGDIYNSLKEIISEGGAAGHMAHPFDLPNVTSGRDLVNVFEQAADSLQTNPGAVKIDGVNSSIRLIDVGGTKQFAMDRGSKKELDIKGITKADLEDRFKAGHGMIKVGGEVLDMFNEALPTIQGDLKKLGALDDPSILFNMEYVAGKTNVQDYGSNFIAIHGLNKVKMEEVPGRMYRGKPLVKRYSQEFDYDKNALQSLLNNLAPIAKKRGFEVHGSVPTEMKTKPNFRAALSKRYTVETNEGAQVKPLAQWLEGMDNIPVSDFIFMNVGSGKKKVGAVSKQVYLAILKGGNVDELFEDQDDKQKAINGFATYLGTEKLGDEVLKVLDSPMGSVENHEGVVVRDEKIANIPFKITGKFILGGMVSDF